MNIGTQLFSSQRGILPVNLGLEAQATVTSVHPP
jgi:hypothetical protein